MKEYKDKFIWNNFINKLNNEFVEKTNRNLDDMIVDDSSVEDNLGVNNEEMMPNYNSLYNETFMDDNDMILDD
jgi:hypothetical protein